MLSMTGFGESRLEQEALQVEATMRGVNHRYLDLALRMPEELRPVEARLRELLGKRLHRGRVELRIELRRSVERQVEVEIDRAVLTSLEKLADELRGNGTIVDRPTFGDLLKFPDLLRIHRQREAMADTEMSAVVEAVEAALDSFVDARRVEGAQLRRVLEERLAALVKVAAELDRMSGPAREQLEHNLRDRLTELQATPGLPEERLAQEVGVLLERSDVREEIDRLRAHLESFAEVLEGDGPAGKRLDFMAQEILRELNTLAAKCRNTVMVGSVVEGKLICEQLREQVQNVE